MRALKSMLRNEFKQGRRLKRVRPQSRQLQNQTPEILEDRALLAAQLLASDGPSKTVSPGETFTVPVIYQTLNDAGAPAALQTNLVSFNVHFDTDMLEYVETSFSVSEGITVVPNETRLESDTTVVGDDNDTATDTVLVASYSDNDFAIALGWPNVPSTDGLELFVATFRAKTEFTGSAINFSANQVGNIIGQGAEFDFQSNSLNLQLPVANTPEIGISAPPAVTEGENSVFTIELSGPASTAVTVEYATASGSGANGAISGSDFTADSQTVTFAAGETQKTVSITTIDDSLIEDSESFTVTLSNPVGATLSGAQATGVIQDNDTPPPDPNISVSDSQPTTEGGDLVFSVSLDRAPTGNVTVDYLASGFGSAAATPGEDFSATSGTLTFTPTGALSQQVTVTSLDDSDIETAETVQLVLSNALSATIADTQGLGTINDNDFASGSAIIEGRKWNDQNGDGTRDANEPFLNGWVIQLVGANGSILDQQTTADRDVDNNGSIDPETETGWYQFSVDPGTYTLQEVAQAGWVQTWPDTPLEALAFQLDTDLQLRSTTNDFLNWGGRNERWMLSAQEWYFLTPDGMFYEWDGSGRNNLTGELIAELNSDYYNDLSLLYDAPEAQFPTYTVADGETFMANFGNINTQQAGQISGRKWNDLNADGQYSADEPWLNGWTIELVSSSGDVVQSVVTMDVDLNNDGQITPDTESGWYQFTNVSAGEFVVREVAQAGWSQTAPLDPLQVRAYELDGLYDLEFRGSLFTDWGGLQERWVQGNDTWYFITPNGDLFRWNGSQRSNLSGDLVAQLSSEYYNDPALLYNATNPLEVPLTVAPGQSIDGINFGNTEDNVDPSDFQGTGNVTARLSGTSLIIDGDSANNGVAVYLNDSGWVTVAGLGDTTVLGSASPWVVEGWTTIPTDLRVNLQGGDDAFAIDGVTVGRHVSVTATGDDFFVASDLTVSRNLDIRSSAGDNTIVVEDSSLGSLARVISGNGNDAIYVNNTSVSGRTVLLTRGGADLFAARESGFTSDLYFDGGTEDDQFLAVSDVSFGRRLTIEGRGGSDAYSWDANSSFSRTPTIRRFESDTISDVDGVLDSVMSRLATAGLDGLLD